MNKTISIIIVTTFFLVSFPVFAERIHKWVDENGVTHYSDEAPVHSASEITLIELQATHSKNIDVENDYYSISNQWMRAYEERIAREKIKLEKAKVKASQRPAEPSIVYVNEPEDRYVVAYPYHFRHKYKHKRKHKNKHKRRHRDRDDSTRHYGDRRSNQNKRSNLNRKGDKGPRRHSNSRRSAKGLTVTAK